MSARRPTRRAFLGGVGAAVGGGALLGSPLGCLWRDERTGRAPTRLLIVHKPCGTVPDGYDCAGGERDFALSPILAPFEDLRDHMVILEGLDIRKKKRTPGQAHGNGMVTFMTGGTTIRVDGFRAVIAERASIDHVLAHDPRFAGDTPLPYVQLAADVRSGRDEIFTRVLTYAGRAAPVPPEHRPNAAFSRLFGGLADGDATALARARARRQSVLDYSRDRLAALSSRVGTAERARLDSHLEAIRETERVLDHVAACTGTDDLAAAIDPIDPTQLDAQHGAIGLAHLSMIRTAFQCDLTRVASFSWAAGNSEVNLSGTIPGVEDLGHHAITHQGSNRAADETAIHRWYNERLAEVLRAMRDTPDVDGHSLLDNTLVVVFSEIRLGKHTFDNVPIQLFGGAGGRLQGGRLLRFDGRSTNDLWAAAATAMGVPMDHFGDPERGDGVLPGVF